MVNAEKKKAADLVNAEKKKAADSEQQVVKKMIDKGYSTEETVFLVSNYSKDDVEALRKKNVEKKKYQNNGISEETEIRMV